MPIDRDELFGRARAAKRQARDLEGIVFEMQVQAIMTRAVHLLVQNSPVVEAQLRALLGDGEAYREEA